RLENARLQFRANSDTGIGEIDDDVMLGIVTCADAELTTRRREFDRVLDDVPKDLLQTRGIGPAMMFFGGEILLNLNLLLVKVARGNAERVSNGGVHV